VRLFDLFESGKLDEAAQLQGRVSNAEWGMGRTGMAGTKYAVEWAHGYTSKVLPRRPLLECSKETKSWIEETMGPLKVLEKELGTHLNGVA
jgi:4-hydroxy-2-oxoglutarate aldolase